MQEAIAKQSSRTFWKSVFKLGSGSAISQFLLVCSFPVLSYLYSPAEFARWGIFAAYITIMRTLIHLKYEEAIIAEPSDEAALQLTRYCLLFGLLNTIISTTIFSILVSHNYFGFGVFDFRSIGLLILFHLITLVVDPIRQLLLRNRLFPLVSNLEMSRGISRTSSQISFGLFQFGYLGLILSEIISRIIMLMRIPKKTIFTVITNVFTLPKDAKNQISRLKHFPLYVLPSAIITVLLFNLGTPLVNYYYGAHDAGLYALIVRSITFPLMLLGNTVADVFYSTLSQYKNNQIGNCHTLFISTAKKLFILGAILCLAMIFIAPTVLDHILGSAWFGSGKLAKAIAPWLMMQLIVTPLSRVLYVLNKQAIKLAVDLFALLMLFCGITLSHKLGFDFISSIQITSISVAFLYTLYFVILVRVSKRFS